MMPLQLQGETTETIRSYRKKGDGMKGGVSDLVQSSGDIVYLASDTSSCKIKLYVLQQNVTTTTKKARAMCFDADVFNPLTFTEEAEREISVKDICGSLIESFVNDKIIEMTENQFIHYQSHLIGHVESVTIEEGRECVGEHQEKKKNLIKKIKTSKEEGKF